MTVSAQCPNCLEYIEVDDWMDDDCPECGIPYIVVETEEGEIVLMEDYA